MLLSKWTIMLEGSYLGSEIAESNNMSIFHLERNSKSTFQRAHKFLKSQQKYMGMPFLYIPP